MFKNRQDAGKLLGKRLLTEINVPTGESLYGIPTVRSGKLRDKIVVLGIPRGGVVIAKEIANVLDCQMDVIVVKKLGAPGRPELAIGAVGETDGSVFTDESMVTELNISREYIKEEIESKKEEIKRRENLYRQDRSPLDLENKIVIITDDGAATGATIIAAAREVWNHKPKKVIIALPVLAKDTMVKLEKEADEVIYMEAPELFYAVGQFYESFEQVSDETVIKNAKIKNKKSK